jgi:hypothetical protein
VFLLAAGQSVASSAAPGVYGFLVVAGMGLAVFFLFRSMTKHLRKVNLAAQNEAAPPAEAGPGGPGAPGRASTGAAATDAAANQEAGRQGS